MWGSKSTEERSIIIPRYQEQTSHCEDSSEKKSNAIRGGMDERITKIVGGRERERGGQAKERTPAKAFRGSSQELGTLAIYRKHCGAVV
jgi:hypothetical protein